MSVRERTWTAPTGEIKTAWVVNYTDQNKKRRLKTFKKKKEADAYAAKAAVEVAAGIHTTATKTVAYAGERWFKSCEKAELERTTLIDYRGMLDRHIVLIGATKLADLTVPKVREFEDELREKGRSPAMVKKILVCLSGILSDAMDRGDAAQNVVHARRAHKKKGKNGHEARQKRRLEIGRDIPALAEIKSLLPHLESGRNRERPLLLTAIFTGLRASELRGLRWEDVDLGKGELRVERRADRFRVIGPPKSSAGQRSVPMLPMVVDALREWKLACPPGELVFPGRRGQPIALQTIVHYHWHPAQVRAGVVTGKDKTARAKYSGFHALRHFYASWCINRKADGGLELPIKVVQGRLGHATIQMTADRYGHLFQRTDDRAEMLAAEKAFMAFATI
jgi:integrase